MRLPSFKELLREVFTGLKTTKAWRHAQARSPAAPRVRRNEFTQLFVMRMEDRRVLNAAPVATLDTLGVLTVSAGQADGQADQFQVTRKNEVGNESLEITVNNSRIFSGSAGQVSVIKVQGSSDSDSLTVDFSQGDALPDSGIQFFGMGANGQPAGDSLTLMNGAADSVMYSFAGPGAGQIDVMSAGSTATIAFSGVTPITDTLDAAHRQFSFSDSHPESLTLTASANDAHQLLLNSSSSTHVNFTDPSHTLSVTADGSDTVDVTGNIDLHGADFSVTAGTINVEKTLTSAGGSVRLDAGDTGTVFVSGTVDVSTHLPGESAGSVYLLGDRVGLSSEGRIDASSDAGNGGFVELSAHSLLYYKGTVDLSAPAGQSGTMFFDPFDIVVSADGTDGANGGLIAFADTPAAEPWNVTPAQLNAVGGNVILQAHNDIAINSAVSLTTAGAAFTAQAGDDILVNASVTTNGGAITLVANDSGGSEANNGAAGVITMAGGTTLNAGNAEISLSAQGTVTVATLTTTNATATAVTVVSTAGNVTDTGTGAINSGGGVTLNAFTSISVSDAISAGAAGLAMTSGTTMSATAGITTSSGGTVKFTNGGALTLGAITINADGAVTQNGAGTVSTAATINTTGDNVSFLRAVTLTGSSAISTAGGNINFSSTVTGTTPATENLTLTAAAGSITFTGAVGAVQLGAIQINSAGDVTANSITAASVKQSAGTGSTTFNGTVNTNAGAGVSLTTNAINVNAAINTTGGGTVTFANAGQLTIAAAGGITADGDVTQTTSGTVSTAGDISTTSDVVSFAGAVTLAGPVTISTVVSGTGNNITFGSTLNGGQNLGLTAGTTGNVNFNGAVGNLARLGTVTVNSAANVNVSAGGLAAASFVQSAGTGTTTLGGFVDTNTSTGIAITTSLINVNAAINTANTGGVTFTNAGVLTIASAGDITSDGAVVQNGSGTVTTAGDITTTGDLVSFAKGVTLATNAVAISTAGGNILFSDILNGGQALNLTAGTGSISFNTTVGGVSRLGAVTIGSANGVTTSAGFRAASLVQSAGTGTMTLGGLVDTDTATGVALTTQTINVNAGITTTGTGTVTFTNAGTLTLAAVTINADGAVTQNGAGSVSTAANITTTTDNVSFARAVTLTGGVAINTAGGQHHVQCRARRQSVAQSDGRRWQHLIRLRRR